MQLLRVVAGCRLILYENSLHGYVRRFRDRIGDSVLFCAVDDDASREFRSARLAGLCSDLVASICRRHWGQGGPGSFCDAGWSGGFFRGSDWRVGIFFP